MTMLSHFAASGGAIPVYIEDVFSTYLYTGNGSTQTITNGIDLSTYGGMVWRKQRNATYDNIVADTVRGQYSTLFTNTTAAASGSSYIGNFSTTGFDVVNSASSNPNGSTNASWTFRKKPKFFDIVTYTGNGANRTIAHNLGSVPGCIIVKRTDTSGAWAVYHRSLANTEYLVLNTTAAKATGATYWNSTTPTSTVFSLGTSTDVNANGGTYVAYLFAHDAGGFGLTGTDNVISCGSYTGTGSGAPPSINLGWEPQYILIKAVSAAGYPWEVFDNMRGLAVSGNNPVLLPNTTDAEYVNEPRMHVNATGFYPDNTASQFENASGVTYIYIAIRRGPMKTPTSGTSVFAPVTQTSSGSAQTVTTNFPVDFTISRVRGSTSANYVIDRLRGSTSSSARILISNTTDPEYSGGPGFSFDSNTSITNNGLYGAGNSLIYECFRRAPGFFDEVCYTGTGVARTVSHNLGVAPELMIVKNRGSAAFWLVYSSSTGTDYYSVLNTTAAKAQDTAVWNNTTPTASVFSLGNAWIQANQSGQTYVAYLFASCPGVSKVGSYTGTGATQTIDCGFTGGARFVLIKRTDSTGDWYVWDSARGIVAGNDPYLLLNSTAAEVTTTDYVDTYSAGFEISSTAPAAINANGGSFIFFAVA